MVDYYSAADIVKMATDFRELEAKYKVIRESIGCRKFATQKGDEFAKQGLLRRTNMLWRCVRKTFELIPPDLEEKPNTEDIKDVTIFLHCFIIHVFGACDDLAWILVKEKGITKQDGSDLPPTWVGFRQNNKQVRGKLSKKMIDILDGFEDWFKHIDDFRHSLAHRIPLYVPPYIIHHNQEEDYRRLELESWEALKNSDVEKHLQIMQEQDDLTFFRPWFTHSFSEESPQVAIHPQILADFGVILKLTDATINEL